MVGEDYFSTGVFAHALPGELFANHTCLVCGARLKTWAGFRAHRAGCARAAAPHPAPAAWTPTAEELDRLAALDALLRGESLEEAV